MTAAVTSSLLKDVKSPTVSLTKDQYPTHRRVRTETEYNRNTDTQDADRVELFQPQAHRDQSVTLHGYTIEISHHLKHQH